MLWSGIASDSIKNLMETISQTMYLHSYTQKLAYDFDEIMDPLCNSYPLMHKITLKLSGLKQQRFIVLYSCLAEELRSSLD